MRRSSSAALALGFALVAAERTASAADVQADPSSYVQKLATLQPGDTLHLAAGQYGTLAITGLHGAPNAWITITGPAGDPPLAVLNADPTGSSNTVEITNSSWVALENVTIDGHDIDGAFGVSAKGGTANVVHHVRIEGCDFVHHHGSQQHDAISTKTPTWGWIIRRNRVLGAGTGLYLGNSDGSDPFVGGLIEDNLVADPIGYCMEIKFQAPRPSVPGMPTQPTSTIIRDNVFIKDDEPSPDGDRPNLLVGGFPASGSGSQDRYEIDRNFFDHNPRESLLQASGRVTIHDNVFVDAPATRALLLQDQDLPLELATVYDNTIYGVPEGIVFGNAAPQGDDVAGNLVFAATPIKGPIANAHDNLTDAVANAAQYVKAPSTTLGQMDFYPLPGKCTSAAMNVTPLAADTDYALDFNLAPRGSFTYRGAYAGSGTNPGWALGQGIKLIGATGGDAGAPGGGDGGGGGTGDAGGGVGPDGSPGASDGGDAGHGAQAQSGGSGGCGCRAASAGGGAPAFASLLVALLTSAFSARRGKRRSRARPARR